MQLLLIPPIINIIGIFVFKAKEMYLLKMNTVFDTCEIFLKPRLSE